MLFQLLKRTANQILSSDLATFHSVDITSIQLALAERQSELPHTSRSGIPVILPDIETRFGSVRLVLYFEQQYYNFIHSYGVCRIWQFLAVLRRFFHSSLSCTFSCHPSPLTILPSSITSSCHLFLGIPLDLVVPKFSTIRHRNLYP